jgi:hypothetical protein
MKPRPGMIRRMSEIACRFGAVRLQCVLLAALLGLLPGCGRDRTSGQSPKMTRALLDDSLKRGRRFLVGIQRPEGNFCYEVHLNTGEVRDDDDHEVRQAGALWALSLLHQDRPGEDTRAAVVRGLAFFDRHSKTTETGQKYIVYPYDQRRSTGTVALVALAEIELLRTEPDHPEAERYRRDAQQYVEMLLSLRRDDGRFPGRYDAKTGKAAGNPSPFYDGETLLALSKAANYLGRGDLEPLILESAEAMYQAYFVVPRREGDSTLPKQFYQWGTMAFLEIYQAGWEGSQRYAARAVEMAHWLADHQADPTRYNTSYSYEGLISAWELARRSGDTTSQEEIGRAIDEGMVALMAWQVDGPLPNEYVQKHPQLSQIAVGGAMGGRDNPWLRIDFTQHQMHAVILARRFIYRQ